MSLWFRLRLGPFGYTLSGRRKRQSYRAYKASRNRRAGYAARYQAEQIGTSRAAQTEAEWLRQALPYMTGLRQRVTSFNTASAVTSNGVGESRTTAEYGSALSKALEAPAFFKDTLPVAPTTRTREAAKVLELHALRFADFAREWDEYVRTSDPNRKTEALAARDQCLSLGQMAGRLLANLAKP